MAKSGNPNPGKGEQNPDFAADDRCKGFSEQGIPSKNPSEAQEGLAQEGDAQSKNKMMEDKH